MIHERNTATGADIVAQALAAAGATRAFGMPGGEVLALVDALQRAGAPFQLARHENAAGFMAEGFWRTTGALPVLVTTLGPGVSNAVTAIAHAHQDRVPMIVLTGCVGRDVAESFTHQIFDHQALLAPITKGSFRVERGTEALVLAKALALATRGRPGPVHIDLPIGVAEARGAVATPHVAPVRPEATHDLSAVRALIDAAERPLVLAGLDLVNEGGGAALEAFLAASGAALVTTYKAKGLVSEHDARVVGAAGLSPKGDAILKPLIDAADLIILAGYDPIEMRAGWREPFASGAPVIDLVAQDMPHGMHRADLLLEGRVSRMLADLAPTLAARPRWPGGEPMRVRATLAAAFRAPDGWGPHAAFETLAAHTPAGTIATVDSGAHRILMSQMWRCDGPARLLQSTGLCTMACALPLAIGAAMGTQRPTLCVVGDAGLEMSLGELATLRDLGAPVVIVVLVDASLGLIALKQKQMGLPRAAVDFGATDFAAVAVAMGGRGVTVSSRDELARAADEAFAHEGFTIIACIVDAAAYEGAF